MLPDTASRTTTDHDEIRRWASERGAQPATLACPGAVTYKEQLEDPGRLHLDVPGFESQKPMQPIGWDEWFRQFEEHKLALLYQEQIPGGEISNFNKIVTRAKVEKVENAVGGQGRSASIENPGERSSTETRSFAPLHMRSDEDPPIPIPPGEDPPPPIQEPPDKPTLDPGAPVREPGPREPKRL